MIRKYPDEVHIEVNNMLLIFSRQAFERAWMRGKAVKRAKVQRAREAAMAEAAEAKRARLQEMPHDS